MKKYNPKTIEKKWQEIWDAQNTFSATENSAKPKKYVLMEFPFPSGDGLHMGHVRGYTAADVLARYYRMTGNEVLYPIGWDAFGLPAENYAIKHGVQPAVSTAKNIANIKKQFKSLGYSFDWSREINTTDPNYYKWTQWLFLKFFQAGLAYEATGLINWCPKDKTGLANEEVVGGNCERCGTAVEKKELRQWYLKITEYAEKLLQGLDNLPDWPEGVKLQQANWIGKSEGAEIDFQISNDQYLIKVFTTRPDTIFGTTYLVLAPEHELIATLKEKIENFADVEKYIEEAKLKQEQDRVAEGKDKTGVELRGVKVINPATGGEIPVWVADYVLGGYGTGAIMAVPAHDERDFEFAKKFGIEVVCVVEPDFIGPLAGHSANFNPTEELAKLELEYKNLEKPYSGHGHLINSGEFSGINSEEAKSKMAEKFGTPKIQYKLRDWVFSRQRYWGEPIPLVHCNTCGIVAVPEKDLPVLLPEVNNYEPTGTGESPLAVIEEWVNTICPQCGREAKRETNTMPQWAGSSWYYLRYTDALNNEAFADEDKLKYWLPVDLYFGGMEHTTLHLLYSRFWNIFLHDQGLVPVSEPYTKRVPHGIILASDGSKMSKSKGNVVNPDELVQKYGADTMRMYELFLGPHSDSVAWSDQGIVGVARFLDKVWHWFNNAKTVETDNEEVLHKLHQLIAKVNEDIQTFSFNTVVSSLMKFVNEVKDLEVSNNTLQAFTKLLSPLAPHIAEELYELTGGIGGITYTAFPQAEEKYLQIATVKIVIQVNGKVKDTLEVPSDSDEDQIKQQVMQLEKIQSILSGQEPKRIIFVPGKLINIVI